MLLTKMDVRMLFSLFLTTIMVAIKGPTEKAWVWGLEEVVVVWGNRADPEAPCFGDHFFLARILYLPWQCALTGGRHFCY